MNNDVMENETESTAPKTPLRWYQYRLRTLLIIMTVFAAYMAMISHRARQQKLAVEKIRALGGRLSYDYQKVKGMKFVKNSRAFPPGPAWLRNLIGEDYFQTVVCIELGKTAVADDDLSVLECMPNLECLSLIETNITSNGLVHLKGLKRLELLSLENTAVDDSGLIYLKDLTNLRSLDLSHTQITDEGTKNLQKLINLEESLVLQNTNITDESLTNFRNFTLYPIRVTRRETSTIPKGTTHGRSSRLTWPGFAAAICRRGLVHATSAPASKNCSCTS
jgi:Leucine-rich repeat (LRR) protein